MTTLTKDLETGIPKIDDRHKGLANSLNNVVSMGVKLGKYYQEHESCILRDNQLNK